MHSETRATSPFRAYLFLLFTSICWGANAVFGRLAVGEVSPMVLIFLRWVGVLVQLVFVARKPLLRDWGSIRPRFAFLCAMGALGYTGFNALYYIAAHTTTAVNIGILQGSIPVFVLLGAFAAFRIKVTALQIVGVMVTLVGVIVVGSGGDLQKLTALAFRSGDILIIVAGLFYAGYTVGLSRAPAAAPVALFAIMASAALLASIPLVAGEVMLDRFQWPTVKGMGVIPLIIVFPSFLAQVSFIRGVEIIGPARAGIFVNLVPIFASILAILILGEPFEFYHGAALVLVLGGIWMSERGKDRTVSNSS